MASVEEKRRALTQAFRSVFTQWHAFTGDVEANAVKLQEMNAGLREQLYVMAGRLEDANRLRQENDLLKQRLQMFQDRTSTDDSAASDDEHISVPATPLLVHTHPASRQTSPSYGSLLKENHEQEAMIGKLTDLLRMEKEKVKKWRLKHNILSSPTSTTSPCDVPNPTILLSSPPNHLQVASTAPEPKPLIDTGSLVLTSPELLPGREAAPFYIKTECLRESTGNSSKRRKVSPTSVAEFNAVITESDEGHDPKTSLDVFSETTAKSSKPVDPSACRRFEDLLAESKPTKPRILGPDVFLKPRKSFVGHFSPPRRTKFLRPKSLKHVPGLEDEEPFRARPLIRLSLDHFKINPDTNEGLDFAYQEVVRNHHDRKCLSACTERCCIDKLRAIAHTLYDSDNRGDETLDEQIGNNGLLLDMLGPNSEEKIRTLTASARANLIEEARVREVGQRHSRHRAAHPRAASPPGFWDADIPCTQEAAQNREKAEKLEREEVERRYQDAMRSDGRWMFADE